MRWVGYISWGNARKRKKLEDLGVDEWMLLPCSLKKWEGVIDWIDLTQDRVGGKLL